MSIWTQAFLLIFTASVLIRFFIGRKHGHGYGVAIRATVHAFLIVVVIGIAGSVAIGFPYAFMMVVVLSPVIVPVILAQLMLSYISKRSSIEH